MEKTDFMYIRNVFYIYVNSIISVSINHCRSMLSDSMILYLSCGMKYAKENA